MHAYSTYFNFNVVYCCNVYIWVPGQRHVKGPSPSYVRSCRQKEIFVILFYSLCLYSIFSCLFLYFFNFVFVCGCFVPVFNCYETFCGHFKSPCGNFDLFLICCLCVILCVTICTVSLCGCFVSLLLRYVFHSCAHFASLHSCFVSLHLFD